MNERQIVLTRDIYYQIIHDLWLSLPPPVSDDPDDMVRRDNAAMAEVASLLPADPAEAAQACKFVAACAYAMDCLRLANEHRGDLNVSMKCMAQAARMMRQSCCARSLLLRIQEARRKREAPGIASDEAVWSDHGILDRMGEALRRAQANAAKLGPQGSSIPGTAERAVTPPTQFVSYNETNSQNHANETLMRLGRPAFPGDGTRDSLPGPDATSRPPHHLNHRPDAPSGPSPTSFAASKSPLPVSDPVTDAMKRVPHPAETMPTARAA